jgi:hypothetical protein
MKLCACAALVVFVAASWTSLSGCSDSAMPSRPDGVSLDGAVMRLPQGASIDAVEEDLGPPNSIADANESETAAQYGVWQLVFRDGLLDRKAREYRPSKPARASNPAFDRAVLSLRLGMSVGSVKSMLGVPTSYERVFEGSDPPIVLLRYGPWEISFEREKLVRRTKF